MLRGLLYKQLFFVADLLLMVVIGGTVIFAAYRFMESSSPVTAPSSSSSSGESTLDIALLQPRAAYEPINEGRLFGDAGQTMVIPGEEPETPDTGGIQKTSLRLDLLGCTSVGPTNPLSAATIRNPQARGGEEQVQTYFVGQTIQQNVTLAAVYKRVVVIKVGNDSQYLPMDKSEDLEIEVPGAPTATPTPVAAQTNQVSVNMADISAQVVAERDAISNLMSRAVEKTDAQGNVIGITAEGIGDLQVATQLGFQESDVLQTINGEAVTGMDDIPRLLQTFQQTNTFRIGVLRGNSAEMLTIQIK